MARTPEIIVHLFCCPNADYFHGASGPHSYYFEYLMIHGAKLWSVNQTIELKNGKEELVHSWRLEKADGKHNVIIDDPSDALIMGLLANNDDDDKVVDVKPIYHVRLCRSCILKGVKDWTD